MKNTGGPAFPVKYKKLVAINGHVENVYEEIETDGMTLRDYFAAKADIPIEDADRYCRYRLKISSPSWEDILKARAFLKYSEADAMLEAREK